MNCFISILSFLWPPERIQWFVAIVIIGAISAFVYNLRLRKFETALLIISAVIYAVSEIMFNFADGGIGIFGVDFGLFSFYALLGILIGWLIKFTVLRIKRKRYENKHGK